MRVVDTAPQRLGFFDPISLLEEASDGAYWLSPVRAFHRERVLAGAVGGAPAAAPDSRLPELLRAPCLLPDYSDFQQLLAWELALFCNSSCWYSCRSLHLCVCGTGALKLGLDSLPSAPPNSIGPGYCLSLVYSPVGRGPFSARRQASSWELLPLPPLLIDQGDRLLCSQSAQATRC